MKTVILAGGYGTRISEESATKPKPMVEIGGRPILWHIMKLYSQHGLNDFIVCLGYKGYVIKEFFANYFLHRCDVRFDLQSNRMDFLSNGVEAWSITLVDTGDQTLTGGRLRRVRDHVGDETFCMTYGDGVSDVNITETIKFHRDHGRLATLTAVQPPGRFGAIRLHENQSIIDQFHEKPTGDGAWINGGFFVLEPEVIDYVSGDLVSWEKEPMQTLAREKQLVAYRHDGFWHSMDTLRDRMVLEDLWAKHQAPWKTWDDSPKSLHRPLVELKAV